MKIPLSFLHRKAQSNFMPIVLVCITLLVAVVFLAMGSQLTQQLRRTVVTCENYNNTAYVWNEATDLCINESGNSWYNYTPNNTGAVVTAAGFSTTNTISSFLPTLGLIAIFTIVIGAIVGMLYLRNG